MVVGDRRRSGEGVADVGGIDELGGYVGVKRRGDRPQPYGGPLRRMPAATGLLEAGEQDAQHGDLAPRVSGPAQLRRRERLQPLAGLVRDLRRSVDPLAHQLQRTDRRPCRPPLGGQRRAHEQIQRGAGEPWVTRCRRECGRLRGAPKRAVRVGDDGGGVRQPAREPFVDRA